jgi:hypothetical protein
LIDAAFNPDTPAVGDPDPQCVGKPWLTSEKPGCGLGGELALLLPLLGAVRRRRRRAQTPSASAARSASSGRT